MDTSLEHRDLEVLINTVLRHCVMACGKGWDPLALGEHSLPLEHKKKE
jgi:hypothetical protein